MIEKMKKGWPYKRLKIRQDGDNYSQAAVAFVLTMVVGAMALAAIGAW